MNKAKNILAICDTESEYANVFVERINETQKLPFEVHAFTNTSALLDYLKNHSIEILLIAQRACSDEIRKADATVTIVLREGAPDTSPADLPNIYKYQPLHRLMRELMETYSRVKKAGESPESHILKPAASVIGVYSPVHRSMKTSFALAMGQILAGRKATLYLNLENFAGFEQLLETEYEKDLSELLYYIRQEQSDIACKISTLVYQIGDLDFIPPARIPMDVQETRYEDYKKLLSALIKDSSYERVILDIGDGVQDIFRILADCDKVFFPMRPDALAQAKSAQFEAAAKAFGYEGILEHIRKIHIPALAQTEEADRAAFPESLIYGPLGVFTEEVIRKEQL